MALATKSDYLSLIDTWDSRGGRGDKLSSDIHTWEP